MNIANKVIFVTVKSQYSKWTVGPLSRATSSPMFVQFTGCHKLVQHYYWPESAIDWLREFECIMQHVWTHKLQMSDPTVHFCTVVKLTMHSIVGMYANCYRDLNNEYLLMSMIF